MAALLFEVSRRFLYTLRFRELVTQLICHRRGTLTLMRVSNLFDEPTQVFASRSALIGDSLTIRYILHPQRSPSTSTPAPRTGRIEHQTLRIESLGRIH